MSLEALSIKLYLPKGSASGFRIAEISNWSGKAIGCARSELSEFVSREEAGRPGVYILIGSDPETGDPAAYVGEAEEVGKRLKQHLAKDFWNQVLAFVSKDENLTKAHIKYLEGKLINCAYSVGKGVIKNSQASGSKLPEADQAEMDVFLDHILKLLPILGTSLFTAALEPEISEKQNPELICKIKGLIARGRRSENGFVVFKDSDAILEHRKSAVRIRQLREQLIEKDILRKIGEKLIFTRNYEASSPSLAASIVRGGNSNGLTCWKLENGKTLKELESEA